MSIQVYVDYLVNNIRQISQDLVKPYEQLLDKLEVQKDIESIFVDPDYSELIVTESEEIDSQYNIGCKIPLVIQAKIKRQGYLLMSWKIDPSESCKVAFQKPEKFEFSQVAEYY